MLEKVVTVDRAWADANKQDVGVATAALSKQRSSKTIEDEEEEEEKTRREPDRQDEVIELCTSSDRRDESSNE